MTKRLAAKTINEIITTYEASKKYKLSTGYLRRYIVELERKKKVVGRMAEISKSRSIWLVESNSLQRNLAKRKKPGRPPAKKKA